MTHADEGYFPKGSMLRRVHEQRAVGLLYGQRALAIGAIDPRNFIGTLRHTRAPDRPFHRLTVTGKMFETIFFGTRAEADRVLAAVHGMHQRVQGVLPDDAGAFPKGTPYSALDPELMLWTVAVMADSAPLFYELFVRPLSHPEREALWQDYIRFGELFGMPREVAPPTWADFRAYWRKRLASPEAHLTDDARYVGSSVLLHIPVPLTRRPAMAVHNLIMTATLPPRVRELYGLRYTPAHAAAFRAAVAGARASRPLAPDVVRRGANTSFFDLVAKTERRMIRRGDPVRGALSRS